MTVFNFVHQYTVQFVLWRELLVFEDTKPYILGPGHT